MTKTIQKHILKKLKINVIEKNYETKEKISKINKLYEIGLNYNTFIYFISLFHR